MGQFDFKMNKMGVDFIWKTPNSYNTNYQSVPNTSGIYVIARPMFNKQGGDGVCYIEDYEILYIGSAKNLKARYQRHEVLRILSIVYGYVQFYFYETKNYKSIEISLIKKIKPKFNTRWH